jgi:hypothetical protein
LRAILHFSLNLPSFATMRILFLLFFAASLTTAAQVHVVQLDAFAGKPGNSIGTVFNHKELGEFAVYTQESVYTTLDTGRTWTASKIPVFAGEEKYNVTVAADAQDNLYYYHTTEKNGSGIVFSRSGDRGKKWSPLSPGPDMGLGKNSFITFGGHPKKDGIGFLWTQMNETEGEGCTSYVNLAVSNSGGKKWADRVRINKEPGDCSAKGTMAQGAPPQVTRDGKIFIVWSRDEKIYIDRSYDGGGLWINSDLPVGEQVGGWKLVVPGIPGLNGVPSTTLDNTDSRTIGTIYIAYTDQKNGAIDTDVWLIRSPNFGDNWTYPLRVNLDEPGKYQYLPRVAIDNATGYLYVAFLDRRNYDDERSDVYLAWSGDSGSSFKEVKINETPVPAGVLPLLSVGARKGVVSVSWTEDGPEQTIVRTGILFQALLK